LRLVPQGADQDKGEFADPSGWGASQLLRTIRGASPNSLPFSISWVNGPRDAAIWVHVSFFRTHQISMQQQ
jgi:hypothetical protein